MPPPKFDVIIQKCWLDALRMPKMQKPQIHVFLKGFQLDLASFPPDYSSVWVNGLAGLEVAPPTMFHGHNFIEVRNLTEAAGYGYQVHLLQPGEAG